MILLKSGTQNRQIQVENRTKVTRASGEEGLGSYWEGLEFPLGIPNIFHEWYDCKTP